MKRDVNDTETSRKRLKPDPKEDQEDGAGELEIDIPSTLTASELHALALQEITKPCPSNPPSADHIDEQRRIGIKLFEMALEKFGEEKSVAHALCLCDFGGMMKMDEFLERALGMLEGVEEGGERWVAIGKVKLEMLRKVQGVEWEVEDDEDDEEEEDEEDQEKEEDEVREETEEELEKAKKEAELFEGLRKAYRTGVEILKKTSSHLGPLASIGRDLLRYAQAQRRKSRKSPIPSTILRWTLALLDPFEASGLPPVHLTSSNLDDDDEDDTESQDTVDRHAPLDTLALQRDGQSLILVRGLCLYTLARCDIDVSDKEGASENLWEAITVLARVDGFDGEDVDAVMEATEVIGQCYVMLGSTELDEESAAEAFENGVKVLKGLSAGMPENERLKKLVKMLEVKGQE